MVVTILKFMVETLFVFEPREGFNTTAWLPQKFTMEK